MEGIPGGSKVQSFIGIVVAIVGNIIISLALNCQKLAHKRLAANASQPSSQKPGLPSRPSQSSVSQAAPRNKRRPRETTPLKPLRSSVAEYSSVVASRFRVTRKDSRSNYTAVSTEVTDDDTERNYIPQSRVLGVADVINGDSSVNNHYGIEEENDEDMDLFSGGDSPASEDNIPEKAETDYLKSKLWWIGFALMNVGEIGNFLSYGFAPASLVAPLGAFALIANCFFAPLMLGERFRKLDLVGLALCILGIVTIVLGGKTSDIRLDPDALIKAISQTVFVVYSIICVVLACILAILSSRQIGQDLVWIDLGLCALFGGYTVLCTKGISTLLSLAWIQIFSFWITYPLAAILLLTGVGQIRYLNRALMKFDGKVVIPTQFVLFNFAAILGSAVLYRDFDKVPFEKMVIFLYGCATTFLGVFMLAKPSPSKEGDDDDANVHDGDGDVDTLSETRTIQPPSPIQHRGSFTFSPTHDQPLPFPGSTPLQTGGPGPSTIATTGSVRRVLRQRASSSMVGLSPAKYLLLATEPLPASSSSLPPPIVAVPIIRQQSTPVPQRQGSYQSAPPLGPMINYGHSRSRGTSRSPSRDRALGMTITGGDGGGESYDPRTGVTARARVYSAE